MWFLVANNVRNSDISIKTKEFSKAIKYRIYCSLGQCEMIMKNPGGKQGHTYQAAPVLRQSSFAQQVLTASHWGPAGIQVRGLHASSEKVCIGKTKRSVPAGFYRNVWDWKLRVKSIRRSWEEVGCMMDTKKESNLKRRLL